MVCNYAQHYCCEGGEGRQADVEDMHSDYIAIACLVWYFLVLIVCAIGVFQMY